MGSSERYEEGEVCTVPIKRQKQRLALIRGIIKTGCRVSTEMTTTNIYTQSLLLAD